MTSKQFLTLPFLPTFHGKKERKRKKLGTLKWWNRDICSFGVWNKE